MGCLLTEQARQLHVGHARPHKGTLLFQVQTAFWDASASKGISSVQEIIARNAHLVPSKMLLVIARDAKNAVQENSATRLQQVTA